MAGVSNEEYVVIIAGGTGTRLWPWSRKNHPKQFLKLFQDKSFLEQVYERAQKIVTASNIFIVAPERYRQFLIDYVPEFPLINFLAEPAKKGTTAAYGYAAAKIKELNPAAIMHIIAADDYILDNDRYQKSFAMATQLVKDQGALVIYGVKPTDPNPGYGYIKVDLGSKQTMGVVDAYKVLTFHEKPTLQVAQTYLADPSYFWHTFGFTVTVAKMLSLIKAHDPATAAILEQPQLTQHYEEIVESNIDEKILESEASSAYMVTLEETWSDVGTWDHLYNLKPKDQEGNVLIGDQSKIYAVGVSNSLIAAKDKPLALVGVDNLVVVDAGDVILICRKDKSQDVKQLVNLLKDKKIEDLI